MLYAKQVIYELLCSSSIYFQKPKFGCVKHWEEAHHATKHFQVSCWHPWFPLEESCLLFEFFGKIKLSNQYGPHSVFLFVLSFRSLRDTDTKKMPGRKHRWERTKDVSAGDSRAS